MPLTVAVIDDSEEYRLIVRGLRHRHARNPSVLHQLLEKCITGSPRRILQIRPLAFGFCANIFTLDKKFHSVLRGKFGYKLLIRV